MNDVTKLGVQKITCYHIIKLEDLTGSVFFQFWVGQAIIVAILDPGRQNWTSGKIGLT